MAPAFPHVITHSAQAWKLIEKDYTLRLSIVANEWATEHLRAWNAVFAEGLRRGNAAYYGPALVAMEIADADKRAEWTYRTCCEIWEIQGRSKCRPLFRAVFNRCLQPMFSMREACFKHGLELHATRTRKQLPQGRSAMLGHMKREMGELRVKWNTKLEIATRDSEYQQVATRGLNASRMAVGNAQRNEQDENEPNDRTPAEQWRELREQFAALANEEKSEVAPGLDAFIRAHVEDGDGIRRWSFTKRNTYRSARFEAIAVQAVSLLRVAAEGRYLVDLWLESLFSDLLQQRKEGAKVSNLLFALKPGDGGIIEQVCQESATFCARLEAKAHADSLSVKDAPPDPAQKFTFAPKTASTRYDTVLGKRPRSPNLKYRSQIKRAILVALTKEPASSDLEVWRSIDADGSVDLPMSWANKENGRSFERAYKNKSIRPKMEKMTTKVRADLRSNGIM